MIRLHLSPAELLKNISVHAALTGMAASIESQTVSSGSTGRSAFANHFVR
jgi:hypothetical protein